MECRNLLRTLVFLHIASILAKGPLQIPLEVRRSDEQLEKDIYSFFNRLLIINEHLGSRSIIAYTGNFDLRPSIEQRLMEHLSMPIYTIGSKKEPLNRSYPKAGTIVVVMTTGLDDPTLGALNDTALAYGSLLFTFFLPRPLEMESMREFFNWCWEREFIRALVFFQGETEFEMWTYHNLGNLTVSRFSSAIAYKNVIRSRGYRFLVQAANDLPSLILFNSSEQADVIGGGNISLSGPIGLLVVDFMRYINATMDILPITESQNSNYEILEVGGNRRVDMVTNLVDNNSLLFSPVITDSQLCLVVPHRRAISINRYFDKVVAPSVFLLVLLLVLFVCVIKCIVHRRRSLVESIFNTIRFTLGIPLPGGQLERLPLADKIVEVYAFLFVGLLISTCVSLLSSAFTTGIYYPTITDVESMRSSGLRIITSDITVVQAFKDNQLPSSLADLVDFVDEQTIKKKYLDLNDSVVQLARTPNWQGLQLYQGRLKTNRLSLAGPKLCANTRHLRLPISPNSPLRFIFKDYFHRIFESGLQQKWLLMGFEKYRKVNGITNLPLDSEKEFKPLTLTFYAVFLKIYIVGMLLSTLVFIIEILYKKYHG